MLPLNELVVIRDIGWNCFPDSVAAEPNIQQIDYLKHCGIIKVFKPVLLRDTVSVVVGPAHVA